MSIYIFLSAIMDQDQLKIFRSNGTFVGSEDKSACCTNSFYILLAYPHFWNPEKIFNFLRDSWDRIKDKKDNNEDVENLIANVTRDSYHAITTDDVHNPDWIKVIGTKDWAILQTRHQKKLSSGCDESRSAVELLRFIRNKATHPEEIGHEDQISLGWFPNGSFDNSAFVTYWTTKFPKLVPLLWNKFYQSEIRSELSQYYSCSLTAPHIENMQLDLDKYMQLLKDALRDHLETGGLVQRYWHRGCNEQHTLEYRSLPSGRMDMVLDGNSSVTMEVRRDNVTVSWHKLATNIASKLKYALKGTKYPFEEEVTTLIFTNCVQDEIRIDESNSKTSRVIFFFNEYAQESSVIKSATSSNFFKKDKTLLPFVPHPLNWSELSDNTQSLIFEEGQVIVQNKVVKIKHILPNDSIEDSFVALSRLSGDCILNDLLARKIPKVFGKYNLPTLPDTYIDRKLFRTSVVTSKVLRHRSPDLFVVSNIEFELLRTLLSHDDEKIQTVQNIGDILGMAKFTSRIFLLERDSGYNFGDVLKTYNSKRKNGNARNIHFLHYLQEDLFLWNGTCGSLSIIKKSFAKVKDECSALAEIEFLANCRNRTNEPIFIADKPGMGKSLLLASLANKISKIFKDSLVVHFHVKDFVRNINNALARRGCSQKNCGKDDIQLVIRDSIAATNFEKDITWFWLEQNQSTCQKIKFELLIDGLDEVDKKYKDFALELIKIIHNEFGTVRLWITMREHMLEFCENIFSVLGHKILPFSEEDQICFITKYWLSQPSCEAKSLRPEDLSYFARKCITSITNTGIETEIAGAPLQCRMLAEIYVNNLGALHYGEKPSFTLLKMYESMIENKLVEYLKEKKGIQNPDDDVLSTFREDMHLRHIYFAIKFLFSDEIADSFRYQLKIPTRNIESIESIVQGQGIIENLNPITFIHRTFAEYFVALFIYKVITDELENVDVSNKDFQNMFIKEVLGVCKHQLSYDTPNCKSNSIAKFKFPVLCYFLSILLEIKGMASCKMENLAVEILDFEQDEAFDCSTSVIFATVQNNYITICKVIIESLSSADKHRFMEKTKNAHDLLLEACIRCASVDFFEYICSIIEEWQKLNDSQFKISDSIFKLALVKGKYDMVKFLVEKKGFGPDAWTLLREKDKKQYGTVHQIMIKSRHDSAEVLAEKEKLLNYLARIDSSIVEQRDVDGGTPLLLPPSANFSLKKFLIRGLGANVNAIGKYSNTLFHWKQYSQFANSISAEAYHEMLETFLRNGFNQINLVNNNGCTPLHCAIKTYYSSLKDETLDLFRNAGADFNTKDWNGNTVLHLCIQRDCTLTFIEKLITCGSDISVQNSDNKCALQLANEKNNSGLKKLLVETFGAEMESEF